MKSGDVLPSCYVCVRSKSRLGELKVNAKRAFGVDPGKIARVSTSDHRLPCEVVANMVSQGECLPECWIYRLTFKDGRLLVYASGGDLDFPCLPSGCKASQVVGCEKMSRKTPADIGDLLDIPHILLEGPEE